MSTELQALLVTAARIHEEIPAVGVRAKRAPSSRLVVALLILMAACAQQRPVVSETAEKREAASPVSIGATSEKPQGAHEDGIAAYDRRDYATALRLLRPLANQGDAVAQDYLGQMYFIGAGVRMDPAEAAKWFRKAAEQGYAPGLRHVGDLYMFGQSVRMDPAEAAKWYLKAAEQGDASAQGSLGLLYWFGRGGVQRDYAESAKWYRKAAEQCDALSQYSLAEAYSLGLGVPQDDVQAHKWASLAAAEQSLIKNEAAASIIKDKAVQLRAKLEARMTPAQIAEAQRLESEWKPK
jgi:TPR repeat protein